MPTTAERLTHEQCAALVEALEGFDLRVHGLVWIDVRVPPGLCPFCGDRSAVESWTKLDARALAREFGLKVDEAEAVVHAYCRNGSCAAREFVVLRTGADDWTATHHGQGYGGRERRFSLAHVKEWFAARRGGRKDGRL